MVDGCHRHLGMMLSRNLRVEVLVGVGRDVPINRVTAGMVTQDRIREVFRPFGFSEGESSARRMELDPTRDTAAEPSWGAGVIRIFISRTRKDRNFYPSYSMGAGVASVLCGSPKSPCCDWIHFVRRTCFCIFPPVLKLYKEPFHPGRRRQDSP